MVTLPSCRVALTHVQGSSLTMVQYYDTLTESHRDWALAQCVFFTASAPLTGSHINLSPKGLPSSSFAVFGPNQAAYVDATGSGNETVSHILENGRITIMFCSFAVSPKILRLFCMGRVVECDQPDFNPLIEKMGKTKIPGARAVILLDIFKVRNQTPPEPLTEPAIYLQRS